jgi:CheY-like chemotaxis protein
MSKSAPPILLVEDDENDIFFMGRAFEKADFIYPLKVVRSGQDAVRYLEGQGIYANRAKHPSPCLVLLDINMPGMNGYEVLEWMQKQSGLSKPIFVVLTSSARPIDVEKAMALGAAEYRVKPNDAAGLVSILRELQAHWLTPSGNSSAVAMSKPNLRSTAPTG